MEYNYGGNPRFPSQPNHMYPNINNANNGIPNQPGYPAPGLSTYPQNQNYLPGQNVQQQGVNPQYPYQPGFGFAGQPGAPPPSAMSYPGAHPPSNLSYPGAPPPSSMNYPGAPSAPQLQPSFGFPTNTGFPNISPTPVYGSNVQWVHTTPRDAHALSAKVVVAGFEGHDGSPLWIIRAKHEGDLIPGKLAIKHCAAYVPWGGKEQSVQSIEVCCARSDQVRWVESRDGAVPPNAVMGGVTSSGETLYIGRAKEHGSLTPGKLQPSHRSMYISFGGKEIAHKTYEVLCTV